MEITTIVSLKGGSSTKEVTTEVFSAKGYIYAEDGSFLEHIDGSDNVFLAKSFSKTKDKYVYGAEPEDLNISHERFAISANVVRHETSGDRIESLWIAHTANNAKDNNAIDYKRKNNTLYDQLIDSNYSTTPASARTILNTTDRSSKANNARAAIIDVLLDDVDPTDGSVLWDGIDFLRKGKNHNKFKEYTKISIGKDILDKYTSNVGGVFDSIFTDAIADKTDFERVGNGKYYSLIATSCQGKSIFWKLGSK